MRYHLEATSMTRLIYGIVRLIKIDSSSTHNNNKTKSVCYASHASRNNIWFLEELSTRNFLNQGWSVAHICKHNNKNMHYSISKMKRTILIQSLVKRILNMTQTQYALHTHAHCTIPTHQVLLERLPSVPRHAAATCTADPLLPWTLPATGRIAGPRVLS